MDLNEEEKKTLNHYYESFVGMKMVLINDRLMIYNNDSLTNGNKCFVSLCVRCNKTNGYMETSHKFKIELHSFKVYIRF